MKNNFSKLLSHGICTIYIYALILYRLHNLYTSVTPSLERDNEKSVTLAICNIYLAWWYNLDSWRVSKLTSWDAFSKIREKYHKKAVRWKENSDKLRGVENSNEKRPKSLRVGKKISGPLGASHGPGDARVEFSRR